MITEGEAQLGHNYAFIYAKETAEVQSPDLNIEYAQRKGIESSVGLI